MDIKQALQTLPHDPKWLDRYVEHLDTCPDPTGTFDRHHILPQALFPDFKSLKLNPWNCASLRPGDHLLAHYYLFKAFPGNFNAVYAFKLMVGKGMLDLVKDDEVLVQEVAAAYEQVRLGRENSPNVKGWSHLYRGDEITAAPQDAVQDYLKDGWTLTPPAQQWINDGKEDRRVKKKELQVWLDKGWSCGRVLRHSEATRNQMANSARKDHEVRRSADHPYSFMPRGDQHPHRIHGIPADVRAKISAALTGRPQAPEHIEKRRLQHLGKHWSWGACSAARRLKSEAMSGKKNPWHGTRGPMGGRRHAPLTLEKMSVSQQALRQDPEFVARLNAARPRGESHWAYGKEVPAETRAKIAAAATGKIQSDETIQKRVESRVQTELESLAENEVRAFEQAVKVRTEEEMLLIRRLFPTNSRPYNILTGLITIRLGKQEQVATRYWQQAWNWLQAAKVIWWEVKPAVARLGTGHPLAPNQQSAHELRKVGVAKGVTRAKQAYAEIPQEERTALLTAWQQAWSASAIPAVSALTSERKLWPVRGRAYNILFGMQWILEGKADPETFERWRQAALFLRLSGREVLFTGAALAELDRVCPPAAIT